MSRILAHFLLTVVSVGWVAAATFLLGDRTIFTSPPEAVAESFGRALATKRPEMATGYLSERQSDQIQPEELRALAAVIEASTGGVEDVSGEAREIRSDTAVADVIFAGKMRNRAITIYLHWEKGEWAVNDWAGGEEGQAAMESRHMASLPSPAVSPPE